MGRHASGQRRVFFFGLGVTPFNRYRGKSAHVSVDRIGRGYTSWLHVQHAQHQNWDF
jgi:hypothetical protein